MDALETVLDLKSRICRSIIGQEHIVERMLIGLLADGNLLVEGLPKPGKCNEVLAWRWLQAKGANRVAIQIAGSDGQGLRIQANVIADQRITHASIQGLDHGPVGHQGQAGLVVIEPGPNTISRVLGQHPDMLKRHVTITHALIREMRERGYE